MSLIKSDRTATSNQDVMLQTVRKAIEIHERLRMSVDKERAFLMSGEFDRAAMTRRDRGQIEREFDGIMGTIRLTSNAVLNGNVEPELIILLDRLRASVVDASDAVRASIAECERDRADMAKKLGTLRTSKRAVNAYARFGRNNRQVEYNENTGITNRV